jgi:pyrroloquinoline-quinone synthase
MVATSIEVVLADAIGDRWLLQHPFYRRWEEGRLGQWELAAYAEQYRHVEAALPELLTAVATGLPDGPARRSVVANLADEQGSPTPHLQLFEGFAEAVGAAKAVRPSTATAGLLAVQRRAAVGGPVDGLSALAVYEVQAASIAASKAGGLRAHYGIDGGGTAFWDVHAVAEVDHAHWLVDALASLDPDESQVSDAARRCASAWWAFLDEREAAARDAA